MDQSDWPMLWKILGAAFAATVWFLRLEGRVNQHDEKHKDLRVQMDTLNTALKAVEGNLKTVESSHNALALRIVEELGRVREALARIEGRIKISAGDGQTLP